VTDTTEKKETYAKFRVSVDNGFRNEFSYIDYRRWGIIELWEAGRITGSAPKRQRPDDVIEVWFNWELVGKYTSYKAAKKKLVELLSLAPVDLSDVLSYLEIEHT